MPFKVLNWQDFVSGENRDGFVRGLGEAARGSGFFLLEGHGIEPTLINHVFQRAALFFDLPPDEKAEVKLTAQNRGWDRSGNGEPDPDSVLAHGTEVFNIGFDLAADDPRILAGEPFRGVNVWPGVEGFAGTMRAYFASMHVLGVRLMRAIALDLGLPERRFDSDFTAPLATLRLLSYPPSSQGADLGAQAYTDYGTLTMLITDGVSGMQVRPRGSDWIEVPHRPGVFVVSIGDALMRWSNDTYVSTPHRMVPPQVRRQSVAFCLDPNPEAVIAALPGTGAPKYPVTTGADYLRTRIGTRH